MLRPGQTGRTAIADGEVLLRVHAAGVDRGFWHLMARLPYAVRLAGYGIWAPKLAPKPFGLTFAQAAAVPVSGLTALQAVRDRGRVQAGQQVLVIGASGGVGTFAVQIAKAHGADVTGVCSTAKADMVQSIGADVQIRLIGAP